MLFENVVLVTSRIPVHRPPSHVVLDLSQCLADSLPAFLETLRRLGLNIAIATEIDASPLARSDIVRRVTCIVVDSSMIEQIYMLESPLSVRSIIVKVQDLRDLIKLFSTIEMRGRLPALETIIHVVLRDVVDEDVVEYVARNAARLGMECLVEGVNDSTLLAWGFEVDGPRRQVCTYIVQRYCRDGTPLYVKVGEVSPLIIVAMDGTLSLSRSIAPEIIERLPCLARINALIEAVKRVRKRFLDGYPLSIEPCITVSRAGRRVVIDGSLVRFLELVDEFKSMRRAAQELGLPQSTIRRRIREVEECLGVRLIESRRGGLDRGCTELTRHGRELVRMYRALYESFRKLIEYSENEVGN